MNVKLAALGALVPMIAHADAPRGSSYAGPEEARPPVRTLVGEQSAADLRVKHLPTKLKMRPKQVAQTPTPAPDAAATEAKPAESVSTSYKMFPTTARDLHERVTFRIRAGVALESAPATGDTLRGGFPLSEGFADSRPWIAGDAVVGARGIIVPSLGGYFLSSFAFDASDSLAANSAVIRPNDAEDKHIIIKAGYAEYGRDDRKPDDQQSTKIWLRGGRQYRLDGGNLFAYFDGLTLGYREKTWNVSAFAGQRVALYVDTEPGVTFGATAAIDLKKSVPVKIALDYMGLAISSTDFDGDGATDGETRHLIALNAQIKASHKLNFDVRMRFTGLADLANTAAGELPGTKFGIGRAGGRVRYETDHLTVIGDLEQRFKDDIAYDLAAPSSVDIVDVANKLGVGMTTPTDATTLGVRVDWLNKAKSAEVLAFARTEIPSQTPQDVDQKGYIEGGFGVAGSPIGVRGSGVYTTAQYTYRQYTDEGADGDMRLDGPCLDLTDADQDGFPDNCQDFGNSASSGLDRMHQLAAEAVLASRGSGGKRWRLGLGGFFRVYDFLTPYREVTNDARGGASLDIQWWFNKDLHLNVAGEVAQSSPTLSRDIGVMTALRAMLEARW